MPDVRVVTVTQKAEDVRPPGMYLTDVEIVPTVNPDGTVGIVLVKTYAPLPALPPPVGPGG